MHALSLTSTHGWAITYVTGAGPFCHGHNCVAPSIPQVDGGHDAAHTPWTAWPVGVRVVVRRRLPGGMYSDVLGELLATSPAGVEVRTRRGDVTVPAADIAVGKTVPPAPPRRPRA